jgi:hypothetical protein
MLKRGFAAVLIACAVGAAGFALDANMDKGTFAATGGVELGWGFGIGGGAEYVFARLDIADQIPLTFGAAGRGYLMSGWGYTFLETGILGTCHVSFKGLDLPRDVKTWSDKLDYYVGLGLGIGLIQSDYWNDRSPIAFASVSGVNYFLKKNLALTAEGGYMGYWGYGLFGVTYKF